MTRPAAAPAVRSSRSAAPTATSVVRLMRATTPTSPRASARAAIGDETDRRKALHRRLDPLDLRVDLLERAPRGRRVLRLLGREHLQRLPGALLEPLAD